MKKKIDWTKEVYQMDKLKKRDQAVQIVLSKKKAKQLADLLKNEDNKVMNSLIINPEEIRVSYSTPSKPKIQFIGIGYLWRDKVNGNTYHSVRVIRCSDKAVIAALYHHGGDEQYRHTAFKIMIENKWIDCKDDETNKWEYQNEYPIYWFYQHVTKKECIRHGIL